MQSLNVEVTTLCIRKAVTLMEVSHYFSALLRGNHERLGLIYLDLIVTLMVVSHYSLALLRGNHGKLDLTYYRSDSERVKTL